MEGRIVTIPNVISVVRLLCVPLFVWLLFGPEDRIAALVLLGILGATDWVDGYIARRFDQGSDLGKILDPTADRILLLVATLALMIDGAVPAWLGIAVLVREAVISIATLALAAAGARRIDVQWAGKAGTFALMFAFPGFLWLSAISPSTSYYDVLEVATWVCAIAGLVLSYYAAVMYVPLAPPGAARGPRRGDDDRGGDGVKAVILAGGEGTRLRPLTSNQPKPMMPLVNRPMLEHIITLLARHGFDDIVVTVAYLGNQIRDYFGDGSDFGVRMRYATEDSPLGTAGSVRNAADELDDTFLVISGDVLTDIDLGELVKVHRESDALASIALKRVENPLEFGIVITKPDGEIERFLEKPTWGQVFSDTINTGIYVLEPQVFDFIPPDEVIDFSGDVFPAALDQDLKLHGYVADCYWEDVGTTEAYLQAHADVLDGKVDVEFSGFELGRQRVGR